MEGTIAEAEVVDKAFDHFEPETVVHAAASYKDPDNWLEDIRTNALGTAHVVRAAERHRVKRLIYFQTALCYGLHPQEQPITLSHPIDSTASSYAISKTAGEQYIALSGLDFISFRLANAYGPRNISGPLPTFYSRLTARKPCFVMDTRRDFIYIDDLIAVVMKAIDGVGAAATTTSPRVATSRSRSFSMRLSKHSGSPWTSRSRCDPVARTMRSRSSLTP